MTNEHQPEKDISFLIKRALKGDNEAITKLYNMYNTRLVYTAKSKLGKKLQSQMDSSDVVQSMWKDALRDIADFEYKGPDSFYRWLLARLINKIQGKGRYYSAAKRDSGHILPILENKSSSENTCSPMAKDPTPSKIAVTNEELANISHILCQFPESHQEVLVLRLRDELEFHKIGERIGKTADATRKIFNRRLKQLIDIAMNDPT